MRVVVFGAAVAAMLAYAPARAEETMIRVMACRGPDAAMEIYLPQMDVHGRARMPRHMKGWYALDLSPAMKGKYLEPVAVDVSDDSKTLTLTQITRGLPPTVIPMKGGTVNFDDRFGTKAKCTAFGTQ